MPENNFFFPKDFYSRQIDVLFFCGLGGFPSKPPIRLWVVSSHIHRSVDPDCGGQEWRWHSPLALKTWQFCWWDMIQIINNKTKQLETIREQFKTEKFKCWPSHHRNEDLIAFLGFEKYSFKKLIIERVVEEEKNMSEDIVELYMF